MKKIRLEFPFFLDKHLEPSLPAETIYLQVLDNHTKVFKDEALTHPLSTADRKVSLEIEVPKELELIKIIPSCNSIFHTISIVYNLLRCSNLTWYPGLKKQSIIFDDMTYEFEVINEILNFGAWNEYVKNDEIKRCILGKNWALEVFTYEIKTSANFLWTSHLAKR